MARNPMVCSLIRSFSSVVAGSIVGTLLAAFICWVWLATVDGRSLEYPTA